MKAVILVTMTLIRALSPLDSFVCADLTHRALRAAPPPPLRRPRTDTHPACASSAAVSPCLLPLLGAVTTAASSHPDIQVRRARRVDISPGGSGWQRHVARMGPKYGQDSGGGADERRGWTDAGKGRLEGRQEDASGSASKLRLYFHHNKGQSLRVVRGEGIGTSHGGD